jgi:hypothetical protein
MSDIKTDAAEKDTQLEPRLGFKRASEHDDQNLFFNRRIARAISEYECKLEMDANLGDPAGCSNAK